MSGKPPIDSKFLADNGLCVQGGMVALEASAPKAVQTDFVLDGLTGGKDIAKAASQPLPGCENPVQVSNTPYRGPKPK